VLAQEDIVWSEGTGGGGSSGQSSYQSSFEDEFVFWQAVNAVMAGFGEAEARAARDEKLVQIANELLLLLPPDEQARAMDAALAELGSAEDGAGFFGPTLEFSGGQGGPAVSAGSSTAETTSGGGSASQSSTSTVLWLLPDNLGTTRDVIDNAGAVVNHITYAAFGAITAIVDASGQPLSQSATRYLYTQREFDFTTHLNYHRARYYDPSAGRWLSEDPIGFAAADTNLARYVRNMATTASDPTGLQGPVDYLNDGGSGEPKFPERYVDGPYGGTPKEPVGAGLAISIYGEEDNPKYKDYATEKTWQLYRRRGRDIKRPLTLSLKDHSVSDICIRSAPVSHATWHEIVRIAAPEASLTLAGTEKYVSEVWNQLNDLKLLDTWVQIETPVKVRIPLRDETGKVVRYADGLMFTVILDKDCKYIGDRREKE
jgi:RHS repeat-associated protein